ncbi:sterol desaturase family protein [Hymenobacter yonginensis]|uniref:Sterol desaturase family protein n=1 Tax=Hymenobacter yonginensis TaxID=748197 RepID=A0ABY7PT03_9BACT|nr:sterol desaturase family protein [Hymenobacter yonginensis]WBO86041.1 sterol desaturase family protein [Hymenobacter yonginensis]
MFSTTLLSVCDSSSLLPQLDFPPTLGYILLAFAGCFVLERLIPGWPLPRISSWPLRVLAINGAQLGVVLLAGVSWEKWLSEYSVFHLSRHVGPVAGGVLAYVVATFVFYWWHRWRHTVDFLWRHFHQIHHSPRRIEVITSFYKHPLEMTVNSILGGLLVFTLLGLSPAAGAVYTLCTALGEFFYHTNVRTPQWIGYVFQRPEMHRIHHEYQKHSHNYGDLPLWDYLFGTYHNPREFQATCGFDADKEERLLPMLLFRDVHEEPTQPPAPGTPAT